jgi:hypothetical protein
VLRVSRSLVVRRFIELEGRHSVSQVVIDPPGWDLVLPFGTPALTQLTHLRLGNLIGARITPYGRQSLVQ